MTTTAEKIEDFSKRIRALKDSIDRLDADLQAMEQDAKDAARYRQAKIDASYDGFVPIVCNHPPESWDEELDKVMEEK